ncbi:HEPN domain-containing protein [Pseudoalteromonas sp. S558]|uniref:HEPN domain-containing protein n=1 Tax=Pseudoalteromonas sp. S558 TaxID=2066515 RepID=UPI00110AB069|nr:HEPN domain-containing protein [Pseudoalteromonas sp. S558]TMO00096.1 hypothetical protein CWB66_15510 [Pseudoalteromonas sp. S558]
MIIDLTICSPSNEKDIENFSKLLREIKILVTNNQGHITPVFDGVSAFYAEKAYPYIHYIENIMRQLFAKFLLIKFGPKWVESIPKDVISKGKGQTTNPLYDLDFIQINGLFFNEYAIKEADSNFLISLKNNKLKDKNIEDYIPQSNWIRYFQPIVECDAAYLKKRWEKLYSQRNKVAHNKLFTKDDFDEVKIITSEIKKHLLPAIAKIVKIQIPDTPIPATVKVIPSELMDLNSGTTHTIAKEDSSNGAAGIVLLGLLGALFVAAASDN